MLQKPRQNTNGTSGPGCEGCPAWGTGQGWVPDEIRERAPVVVYAQEPGKDEVAGRKFLGWEGGQEQYEPHPQAPLIGKTGRILDKTFLPLAGLSREDCSFANSIRCRWTPSLPPLTRKEVQQAIRHCTQAHWKPPEGARMYVATGEYAYYTLTGHLHDFSGWRGYVMPKRHPWEPPRPVSGVWTPGASDDKVFVTYHLAYLWKEPEAELPAKRDWNKLASILDGTWPTAPPQFNYGPPAMWPSYAAFDTEFTRDTRKELVRYSVATREHRVWVVEAEEVFPRVTLPGSTVILHNAPADIPHVERYKIFDLSQVELEDTMYAHAVLWTGKVETDEDRGKTGGAMSHKLNFLGSMYSQFNRWKHLDKIAPKLYSGMDALGTMDVWETGLHGGLKGELARDPQSQWVYTHLQKPLIPIIVKAQARGIAVNREKVKQALTTIRGQQTTFIGRAQAYAGWPINLRSPKQLAYWLFDVEGLKRGRKRKLA